MHVSADSDRSHPTGPGAAAAPTPDLARTLAAFTKYVLHRTGKDFYAAVGELDLSLTQIRALHILTNEVEEASLNQLADAIGLSLPAASRSVDGLVQRGLVSRTENANDRRAKTLAATDDAHALVNDLTEMRVAALSDFVDTLTDDDRERLQEALTPIVAGLPTAKRHA
jgi:DNA-binding MarR family transcriptional regulator